MKGRVALPTLLRSLLLHLGHGGLDEALGVWRREIARGQELCAGRSLDDTGVIPDGPMAGLEVSLRWVLLHMVEEYARHNGHADILRERIGGVTGA